MIETTCTHIKIMYIWVCMATMIHRVLEHHGEKKKCIEKLRSRIDQGVARDSQRFASSSPTLSPDNYVNLCTESFKSCSSVDFPSSMDSGQENRSWPLFRDQIPVLGSIARERKRGWWKKVENFGSGISRNFLWYASSEQATLSEVHIRLVVAKSSSVGSIWIILLPCTFLYISQYISAPISALYIYFLWKVIGNHFAAKSHATMRKAIRMRVTHNSRRCVQLRRVTFSSSRKDSAMSRWRIFPPLLQRWMKM